MENKIEKDEEKTQLQWIFELRAEGKSFRQIAKITGCSKSTLSYHFSDGQKAKTRERAISYRERLRQYIINYKESRGCADCKRRGHFYEHPYYVLQADHVWGTKEVNVSKMIRNNSLEEIEEELAKCDIVCANCHAIRTHRRRTTKVQIDSHTEEIDEEV